MITTELLTDNEECLYFCIESNGPFTLLKIHMNSDSFVCRNVFWLLEIIAFQRQNFLLYGISIPFTCWMRIP